MRIRIDIKRQYTCSIEGQRLSSSKNNNNEVDPKGKVGNVDIQI